MCTQRIAIMKSLWHGVTDSGVTELGPIAFVSHFGGAAKFLLDKNQPDSDRYRPSNGSKNANKSALNGDFRAIRFPNQQTALAAIDMLLQGHFMSSINRLQYYAHVFQGWILS
jgi:hypothetical protein